jgi:hypothetical protein
MTAGQPAGAASGPASEGGPWCRTVSRTISWWGSIVNVTCVGAPPSALAASPKVITSRWVARPRRRCRGVSLHVPARARGTLVDVTGIQNGRAVRRPIVGSRAHEQWVVQPLVDAGVELDQIRALVFHLAFEDIVTEGRGTLASSSDLVADQPPEVQAAWAQMIGRMLVVELLP